MMKRSIPKISAGYLVMHGNKSLLLLKMLEIVLKNNSNVSF